MRATAAPGSVALVRAETPGGAYAVPVERARAVLPVDDVRPLPAPAPDVAGLLEHRGEQLAVLQPFGAGDHVLVLDHDGRRFGLVVARVTGVVRLRPEELAPAPAGQAEPLVTAVVRRAGAEALVLDPAVLARRLAAGATD